MRDMRRSAAMIVAVVAACSTVLTGAGGASAGTQVAMGARAAASGGTWGTAEEVPGTATLNQSGGGDVVSVSCATAGNCSAGGQYTPAGTNHIESFVADEVNGTWQSAMEVPGTAKLNQGGQGQGVLSVSCATAGNCSAGGQYADGSGGFQAFVANEVKGKWRAAQEVPGTATLNQGGFAVVASVSCAAAGSCSAGGSYRGSTGAQAFVANEVKGKWRAAQEVPGTATLNQDRGAAVASVSCAAAGSCSAGGTYLDSSNPTQVFVASEVNGTWQDAIEVPGTATLNQGGDAHVYSVSCATAGNCSTGGPYTDSTGHTQAFVATEVNGSWQTAIEVPGTATLNQGGNAAINSVSCAAAGTCSAGGYYTDSSGARQALVVDEVNGSRQTAIEVPGTATLNQGGFAETDSVSCAAAGTCSAGGRYEDSNFSNQAFVVNETS